MTTDLGAILPDMDDLHAAPFWTAAKQGELRIQRCLRCAELRWTPQDTCPSCLSRDHSWDLMSGRGKVYSFCTYYRVLNPSFTDVPYTVVMVELDEGPVLIGRLLNRPSEAAIDKRVVCVFTDVTNQIALVNFAIE